MNEPSTLSAALGYLLLIAIGAIYYGIRVLWFPFPDDDDDANN